MGCEGGDLVYEGGVVGKVGLRRVLCVNCVDRYGLWEICCGFGISAHDELFGG